VSGQRADVIIAIVIDPRRPAAVVLSIPRDTRVEIPGEGLDKINASYNEGPQKVVDTVANFIGLPINHFVDVGFVGFMRLVDAVGNVPVCTERTLKDDFTGLYLPAGCHDLNGGAALPLVRSRHTLVEISGEFVEDPTGDFGRILRQQQFLRSLFAKVAKPSNITKFPTYIDAVSDTIRADGAFGEGDAVALGRRFLRADPNRLFMVSLPGAVADQIGGISYVLPTPETTQFLAALREGRPLPGEPGRPVAMADVRVTVRNGTQRQGCAQTIANLLDGAGATISEVGAANRTDLALTEIRYNPGDQPKADVVRGAIGFGAVREFNHPGPEVEVIVGQDAAPVCPE
jgi:LCP family protein required for cell wall assembly